MNDFTASNGVTVANWGGRWDQSTIHFEGALPGVGEDKRDLTFEDRDLIALEEFFQAKRDETLGRWRWPENPDYLVYPQGLDRDGFRYAMAVYEPLGTAGKWQEGQSVTPPMTDPALLGIYAVAAYFAAHPEPKDWDAAAAGEVWAFKIDGLPGEFAATLDQTGVWNWTEGGAVNVYVGGLIGARRIWPEVSA